MRATFLRRIAAGLEVRRGARVAPQMLNNGKPGLETEVDVSDAIGEDLVLVDSVRTLVAPRRLAAAGPTDRMLLAWYYAEQGSYAKSRRLLAETGAAPVKAIVSRRLRALGRLGARPIRHSPEGNGNRYEPLLEERFPKLITEHDEVVVRAQAVPLAPDDPLELVIGEEVVSGAFRGDCWEFVLDAPAAVHLNGTAGSVARCLPDEGSVRSGPWLGGNAPD